MQGPRRTTLHGARRRLTRRGKPSCSRCSRKSLGVRGLTVSPTSGRVQRHTVEYLTDLVRFAPKVQVLDAPAPLVVEKLVDVLALVEKKEREEDARMDQLEEMILTGQPVSVADKEAWRRRAKAGGPRPRRKKKKKKRKLPRTFLRPAAPVPAVQARDHGGAPVPVHRPSASHSSCMKRQVRSVHTVQVCGDFTGAAFEQVVDVPVVVRQGLVQMRRQLWRSRSCSSWPRLYSSLCSDRCSGPNSAELCLEAHSCSSWTRLMTCPLSATTRARDTCCPDTVHGLGCCRAHCATTVERATDHGGNREGDSACA